MQLCVLRPMTGRLENEITQLAKFLTGRTTHGPLQNRPKSHPPIASIGINANAMIISGAGSLPSEPSVLFVMAAQSGVSQLVPVHFACLRTKLRSEL
jgi:hypothetical protein